MAMKTFKGKTDDDKMCCVVSPNRALSCELEFGHQGPHQVPDGRQFQQRSWMSTDDTEPDAVTTVDGKEAEIVFDGATGSLIEEKPELISVSLEDRIRAIAVKRNDLMDSELAKKRASEHHKALQDQLNVMVDALIVAAKPQQLRLIEIDASTGEVLKDVAA